LGVVPETDTNPKGPCGRPRWIISKGERTGRGKTAGKEKMLSRKGNGGKKGRSIVMTQSTEARGSMIICSSRKPNYKAR